MPEDELVDSGLGPINDPEEDAPVALGDDAILIAEEEDEDELEDEFDSSSL